MLLFQKSDNSNSWVGLCYDRRMGNVRQSDDTFWQHFCSVQGSASKTLQFLNELVLSTPQT